MMAMLLLGVVLFAGVHFIPSLAPALKTRLQASAGDGGYKGIFSLLLLASFALMVIGWRSATPTYLYTAPTYLHVPAMLLVIVAFFLFVISNRPSKLRRFVRHPQLCGVALWAIAHLLMNGDSRSLILFGGLLLWSVAEVIAINRRDRDWTKQASPAWSADSVNVATTLAVVAVVILVHPWLAGVPVYW